MRKCKQYGGANNTDFFAGALRAPVQIIFHANSKEIGLTKKFKQYDDANNVNFFAWRASRAGPNNISCKQL